MKFYGGFVVLAFLVILLTKLNDALWSAGHDVWSILPCGALGVVLMHVYAKAYKR